MAVSLLSTKLHIPHERRNTVSRPRLIEKLLAGVRRPGSFALLSCPAGFGKTTLLSEFVVQLQGSVAWVSLDEGDNDPGRFWTYVISACQLIQREVGQAGTSLLQTAQVLPDDSIPTILINDLAELNQDAVLVLDDYHTIQNVSIHAGLAFLLEHLPPNLHPVISTRVDPPWPLARFRARDQLVEIRATDLRFTADEAATFLNDCMGLQLPAEDVAALDARTEGWVASLQLAAISMKGRSNITGFIKAFTGSHVYVAEYLVEEVLGRQSDEVKTFLLQTSILERLNSSLCKAVTEREDSEQMLKALNQSNLFILPLDQEGQWFRYHQLFADLLRARLQQSMPRASIAALHQRAAAWYEQAGLTPEAIDHALLAGDYSYAVQLVEELAMPMITKAYFKTVEDWLHVIPPQYISTSARAQMALAWMYLMRRNFPQAVPHIERLQEIFSGSGGADFDAALQGQWLAIQSMLLNAQGKAPESKDLAEHALKLLPVQEAQVRSMVSISLVSAYQQMLDYEHAAEVCQVIIQQSLAAGDLASEVLGRSLLGRMLIFQGRLYSAREIASQALQRIESTGSFSPFSATLYGELAQVYYHWHQLEEAREFFSRSAQWGKLGGFSDAEIYHSVFLSRLFQLQGNLEDSVHEIEKALDQMRNSAPALVGEEVVSQQVSIYLALDRPAPAETALRPYGFRFEGGISYPALTPDGGLPHAAALLYNSALRVLLYRGRTGREPQPLALGTELASLLIEGSTRCGHLPMALKSLLLRAQLHVADGNAQAGLADVVRAVELAEPEGFISTFLEEGEPLAELLTSSLESKQTDAYRKYVHKILASFPGANAERLYDSVPPASDDGLIEPLTPREREVLQLIAAGDSNQSIAEKLFITISAVKKHTGNIFGKLNVSSRTQAVARARQLGLLSSDH